MFTCKGPFEGNITFYYRCEYTDLTCSYGDNGNPNPPIGSAFYGYNKVQPEPPPNECATAPSLGPSFVLGTTSVCSGGCQYEMNEPGGIQICLGEGSSMYCSASSWKATGNECTASDKPPQGEFDPNKATCASRPGMTECVKPNGEHCVTGAAGSTLCWTPDLTGPRMTADGTYAGDREVAPATPTPPPNQAESAQIASSQTTINGNTYNTTTWSGTGNTGGQSNTGGGQDSGVGGDGSGNGDDGSGDGAGPGVGELYTGTGDTVSSVFAKFKTEVQGAPLLNSASNFLGGCSGGGQCPNETWDGGEWAGKHDLSALCTGALASLLGFAGWVMMAGFAAVALRWALL